MDKAAKIQLAEVAALMRDLKGSQGWACFTDAMRGMIDASVEGLLQAPAAEFEYRKGRVHGLRDALQLPDLYIQRSKQNA